MTGMSIEELITPCLLLDMDAAEANFARAMDYLHSRGKALRPHFKVHRSVPLARWQIERGAAGITCARLDEAESLIKEGIGDVLVANTFAGRAKCACAARIAARGRALFAVDNPDTLAMLSEEAVRSGTECRCVIDINLGMDRSGVPSPEDALSFYALLSSLPHLRFAGLMGYEGHLVARQEGPEKEAAIEASLSGLSEAVRLFRSAGIEVPLVSAGGTGSYRMTAVNPEVTELQMGTFMFMDDHFRNIGVDFLPAAFVTATVLFSSGSRVVLDCGMKGMHPLHMPSVRNDPFLKVDRLNAEHAICTALPGAAVYAPGNIVALNISYADGTFNLYSGIYGVRQGKVERIFPCLGRERMAAE